MKKFTFYWLDGKRSVLEGAGPADALNKAGYGQGAIAALDFHAEGDNDEYFWGSKTLDGPKEWHKKSATIRVRMMAFATGADEPIIYRDVHIPYLIPQVGGGYRRMNGSKVTTDKLLQMVFEWGQNDFQPQKINSVSAYDVVEIVNGSDTELWNVEPMGFRQITEEQFKPFHAATSRDRQFWDWDKNGLPTEIDQQTSQP